MKLYHGTSESLAQKILKEGVTPRGKRKTNWKHTVESNANTVYLTTVYAPYFAMNCVKIDSKKKKQERAVIFEIDHEKLESHLLRPDEDFLEQAFRGQDDFEEDLNTRTRYYRGLTEHHQSMWATSLNMLGTGGYAGKIPPSAFTRVSFWNWQETPLVTRAVMDPAITIMNYAVMRDKYEAITRWLMGETISVEEYMGLGDKFRLPDNYRQPIWTALLNTKPVDVTYLRKRMPACFFRPWAGIFDRPQDREVERGPKTGVWLQKQLDFNQPMNQAMKLATERKRNAAHE